MSTWQYPARNPALDRQRLQDIHQLARGGDIVRASELARAALDDGLVHPMLLNLRSDWWERQGRAEEAVADLKRAAAIDPGDPVMRHAYGLLLARLNRLPEAAAAYDAALRVAPRFFAAWYDLGLAKSALREADEGRRCFEKAHALDPRDADTLARLGELAEKRGEAEAAQDYCARALALDGTNSIARAVVVALALGRGATGEAEGHLAALVAMELPVTERATAKGLLGDLRHAQGRYREAFAAYEERNRLLYELHAPDYDAPDIETMTDHVRRLVEELPERRAP